MRDHSNDDLTPQEQAAYQALSREKSPPADLEKRVVSELWRRGLLHKKAGARRRAGIPPALALAASVLVLLGGAVIGVMLEPHLRPSSVSQPQEPRFLLLLRGSAAGQSADLTEEFLRTEYTRWAREQAGKGVLVSGEELDESGRILRIDQKGLLSVEPAGTPPSTQDFVAGYFLIRAGDYGQAVAIARGCPHLKYGGTVEVRALEEGN